MLYPKEYSRFVITDGFRMSSEEEDLFFQYLSVKPHAVGGGKCGLFSETLQLNCGMISAAAGC
jgi:hypothetical protein